MSRRFQFTRYAQGLANATKVTRLLEEDVRKVCALSGMEDTVPFWAKFHAVLGQVERARAEVDIAERIAARLTRGA